MPASTTTAVGKPREVGDAPVADSAAAATSLLPAVGAVTAPAEPDGDEAGGGPVLGVGEAGAAVASASEVTSRPTAGVAGGSAKPQSSREAPCIQWPRGCWVPCIMVT